MKRWGPAALVVLAALAVYLWATRDTYEPIALSGALVQMPFEGNLRDIGRVGAEGVMEGGAPDYDSGPTGRALHTQGDGRQVDVALPYPLQPGTRADVSFDVRPAAWINPHPGGGAVRTVVVLSGRQDGQLVHLSFNLSTGPRPALRLRFTDVAGRTAALVSQPGTIGTDWHSIRLDVAQDAGRSELFLDGTSVGVLNRVPAVFSGGIERIRLGAWHKRNQAYRGLIDNLVIRGSGG